MHNGFWSNYFCTLSPPRLHSQHVTCCIVQELFFFFFFAAMVVNLRMTPCAAHASESAADTQCNCWTRGWRTTTIQNTQSPGSEFALATSAGKARTLYIPPSISCVHEFTSGGHRAGFTTGQQKHVILRHTPYLGAYVRENQVHVPLISIIHHKLCKGAIGRAKA